MIKGITTIRHVAGSKEFKALSKLFDAMGFERGTPWKTARGQGAPFKAPMGQIEFVEGLETIHADIWIEVTDLDSIRDVLAKENAKGADKIQQTAWDSRFLVAEPAKGSKVLFWQKNRPSEDAIEGDLNARGMRFGVVVSRWNSFITERLLQGALDALGRSGCRYEDISTEITRGIGQSAQETGVPHTYSVLTCENLEQALDRAGLKAGNKGFEAAISAIEMVSLQRKTQSRAKTKAMSRKKKKSKGR